MNNDINKKLSQSISVDKTDSTTQIPIIQGSPAFNAKITPEDLVKSIAEDVKIKAELDKVDNTSDLNKPVSEAQDAINKALDLDIQTKESKINVAKKVDKEDGKSLIDVDEIDRLSTVVNQTRNSLDIDRVDNTSDKDKPLSDSVKSALGGKVNNERVLTDVPKNAKFTDTVYTHPNHHSASMISETPTRRFVTDIEKSYWDAKEIPSKAQAKATEALNSAKDYVDAKVKTDVPKNAVFTDTPTDISGKVDKEHGKSLIDVNEINRLKNVTNQIVPTKNSQLENDSQFLVAEDLADLGGGDMLKAVYDTDDDGIVDNAKKVNGFTVESNVPADAKFTDTEYTAGSNISIEGKRISVTGQLGLTEQEVKQVKVNKAVDADTVGGFSVGVNVPADAVFTDTKYEAGENIEIVGNTINSLGGGGGSNELIEVGVDGIIDLSLGNTFLDNPTADTEYSIINAEPGLCSFTLFVKIRDMVNIIFPESIHWVFDKIPDLSTEFDVYMFDFTTLYKGKMWYGEIKGSHPLLIEDYFMLATDDDFIGEVDGEFEYIGTNNYPIIPKIIKGVTVTKTTNMFGVNASPTIKTVVTQEVNSIIDMGYMFNGFQGVELDLSNFYTNNVTNMEYMFNDCEVTSLDVSSFNTINVTNMDSMFKNCKTTTLNISNFNTNNVTNMNSMFEQTIFTELDLSNFNTSEAITMSGLFKQTQISELNLSLFNTTNVTNMSSMFEQTQVTELDLSSFDISNVTETDNMFKETNAFVGYAQSIEDAIIFNNSINKASAIMFNTKDAEGIPFYYNISTGFIKQDNGIKYTGGEDYIIIPRVAGGFYPSRTVQYNNRNTFGDNKTIKGVSLAEDSAIKITYRMFANFSGESLDLSHFNSNNITDMSDMFNSCTITKKLNLSGSFDTSNVTNMSEMFSNATINYLDLTNFDMSKLTDMSGMFYRFKGDIIDMSTLDLTGVQYNSNMFLESNVNTIYVRTQADRNKLTRLPAGVIVVITEK